MQRMHVAASNFLITANGVTMVRDCDETETVLGIDRNGHPAWQEVHFGETISLPEVYFVYGEHSDLILLRRNDLWTVEGFRRADSLADGVLIERASLSNVPRLLPEQEDTDRGNLTAWPHLFDLGLIAGLAVLCHTRRKVGNALFCTEELDIKSVEDLQPGDPIIHRSHGWGRYEKLLNIELQSSPEKRFAEVWCEHPRGDTHLIYVSAERVPELLKRPADGLYTEVPKDKPFNAAGCLQWFGTVLGSPGLPVSEVVDGREVTILRATGRRLCNDAFRFLMFAKRADDWLQAFWDGFSCVVFLKTGWGGYIRTLAEEIGLRQMIYHFAILCDQPYTSVPSPVAWPETVNVEWNIGSSAGEPFRRIKSRVPAGKSLRARSLLFEEVHWNPIVNLCIIREHPAS